MLVCLDKETINLGTFNLLLANALNLIQSEKFSFDRVNFLPNDNILD